MQGRILSGRRRPRERRRAPAARICGAELSCQFPRAASRGTVGGPSGSGKSEGSCHLRDAGCRSRRRRSRAQSSGKPPPVARSGCVQIDANWETLSNSSDLTALKVFRNGLSATCQTEKPEVDARIAARSLHVAETWRQLQTTFQSSD